MFNTLTVYALQKFKGCFDQIWLPVMRTAFIPDQSPLQYLIAQNFRSSKFFILLCKGGHLITSSD